MVRRTAFKDEAAIAIATIDEADFVVDLIINAGVAECGVDLAGAVAMDPVVLGPKDFRRRLHGNVPSNRLPPLQ
jgi:hypothetical protein